MYEGDQFITLITSFVVDPKVATTAPPLFRIDKLHEYIVVREDLAKALEAKGFTNMRWIKPEAIATGEGFESIAHLDEQHTASL